MGVRDSRENADELGVTLVPVLVGLTASVAAVVGAVAVPALLALPIRFAARTVRYRAWTAGC